MQLIGVTLRKPTFFELTGAVAGATLVFFAVIAGATHFDIYFSGPAKGLLCVAFLWGSVSMVLGIRVGQGVRQVLLFLTGGLLLLLAYFALAAIFVSV